MPDERTNLHIRKEDDSAWWIIGDQGNTPGTLTVSTSNDATDPHTHAITTNNYPGAAASILATDADGILVIDKLGVRDGSPTANWPLVVNFETGAAPTDPTAQVIFMTTEYTGVGNQEYRGLALNLEHDDTQNHTGFFYGCDISMTNAAGSGDIDDFVGVNVGINTNVTGGTVTNGYGLYIDNVGNPSNFTNLYGLYIGTLGAATSNYAILTSEGNVVINDDSDADSDLQVKSNNQTHMLFVDSGFDSVLVNGSTDLSSTFGVTTTALGDIGVVVRGSASQAASLQEWQDSAAAVLASIDAAGKLTAADVEISSLTASTVIYSDASKEIESLANAAGYLKNDGAGSLSWDAGVAGAHNILSATHTDSAAAAVTDGDIIIGNGTPEWSELAISVPAANVRNVLGVDNGETRPSWKTALDANNPTTLTVSTAAAPGTSLVFSHRDHAHAITSSSNPGAAAAILASDASGYLRTEGFYVGVAPDSTAAMRGTVTVSSGDANGGYFTASATGAASTVRGVYAVGASGTGGVTTAVGFGGHAFANYSNVTSGYGVQGRVLVYSGQSMTTGVALYAEAAFLQDGTASITNAFGLLIDSVTAGSGTNYAIQTAAGNVVFNEGGDASTDFRVEGDTYTHLLFVDGGDERVGVNVSGPAAQLDVDQSAAAGAIAVLRLDQGDDDVEFINFVGTSAGDQTKSISTVNGDGAVEGPKNYSTTAGWAFEGMIRVAINGTDRWIPYYSEDTS